MDHESARRLFMNEPGVVLISNPKKGKRVCRTPRIPVAVYDRILTQLTRVVEDIAACLRFASRRI